MSEESAEKGAAERLRFYYIKSNHFRVVHADGIIGSVTPQGLIHFAIYNERPAIPQSEEREISPEGRLSDPLSQEGKIGIVRETEVDVIMSPKTATAFRDWLNLRIAEVERLIAESTAAKAKSGGQNAS